MPIGVNWDELDYSSTNDVCQAISKLIIAIVYLLDPERIILYGRFINEEYLKNINTICEETIMDTTMTQIYKSEDFNLDYENGISKSTLDLLEKTLMLTK